MTKAITLLALTCVLVIGAAVTSILARDSIPAAGVAAAVPDFKAVVPNREAKQDKLMVLASLPQAAVAQPQEAAIQEATTQETTTQETTTQETTGRQSASRGSAGQETASKNEPLRQAYASTNDAEIEAAKAAAMLRAVVPAAASAAPDAAPAAPDATAAAPDATAAAPAERPTPAKPKVASHHPQPEKYALLSDAQIAGIKQRLRLSPDQEYYWPAVDRALHAIARKIEAARQVNPHANAASLDPDSPEVQELKSAAMPLLFQLREDQKDEVRKLARVIGLEKVAAEI